MTQYVPTLQRSVVILKDVLDEQLGEIAALLDLTVDAVKGHLARGRARLREINVQAGAVTSIHEQTRVKEPGLEKYLRYDRWARHAFRILIFAPSRKHADYESLQLQEDAGFAGGETARQADPAAGAAANRLHRHRARGRLRHLPGALLQGRRRACLVPAQ